eukprot:g80360.t1
METTLCIWPHHCLLWCASSSSRHVGPPPGHSPNLRPNAAGLAAVAPEHGLWWHPPRAFSRASGATCSCTCATSTSRLFSSSREEPPTVPPLQNQHAHAAANNKPRERAQSKQQQQQQQEEEEGGGLEASDLGYFFERGVFQSCPPFTRRTPKTQPKPSPPVQPGPVSAPAFFTAREMKSQLQYGSAAWGNNVRIYASGEDAWPEIWAAIKASKHYVYFETFMVQYDHIGMKTVEAMLEAADNGCEVCLMYDHMGSFAIMGQTPHPLMRRLGEHPNVQIVQWNEIKINPFKNPHWYWTMWCRNHRKLVLCDEKVGFTGGMNCEDAYAPVVDGGSHKFRDSMVRLEGPAVKFMTQAFLEARLSTTEGATRLKLFASAPTLRKTLAGVFRNLPALRERARERLRMVINRPITRLHNWRQSKIYKKLRDFRDRQLSKGTLRERFRQFRLQRRLRREWKKREMKREKDVRKGPPVPVERESGFTRTSLQDRLYARHKDSPYLALQSPLLRPFRRLLLIYRMVRFSFTPRCKRMTMEVARRRSIRTIRAGCKRWLAQQLAKKDKQGQPRWSLQEILNSPRARQLQGKLVVRTRPQLRALMESQYLAFQAHDGLQQQSRPAGPLGGLAGPLIPPTRWQGGRALPYPKPRSPRRDKTRATPRPNLRLERPDGDTSTSAAIPPPPPPAYPDAEPKQQPSLKERLDWEEALWLGRQVHREVFVQVITSNPFKANRELMTALVRAMGRAKKIIRLTNSYFLPYPELRQTILAVAKRGVKIQIITQGDESDTPFMVWGSFKERELLFESCESKEQADNIEIYDYQPRVLHAKLAVIDNVYASVGSANLDPGSRYMNLELDVVMWDAGCAAELNRQFERDLKLSRRWTMEGHRAAHPALRFMWEFTHLYGLTCVSTFLLARLSAVRWAKLKLDRRIFKDAFQQEAEFYDTKRWRSQPPLNFARRQRPVRWRFHRPIYGNAWMQFIMAQYERQSSYAEDAKIKKQLQGRRLRCKQTHKLPQPRPRRDKRKMLRQAWADYVAGKR